jgi:hypothetical protein
VVSPNDTAYEVETKIQEYLGADVPLGLAGQSPSADCPDLSRGRDGGAPSGGR